MIIKFFSDLHTEFGSKWLVKVLLDDDLPKVFICAGDLSVGDKTLDLLREINEQMEDRHFIFVPGNHEYYGTQKVALDEKFRELNEELTNVYILNQDTVTIGGVLFAGATGWWDVPMTHAHIYAMNDFSRIYDIKENFYGTAWGRKDRLFFEKELPKHHTAICITHNAPSLQSILPQYQGSDINECFANDWGHIIQEHQPIAWIHGHMHNTIQYEIGNTQVVCNPYGYYGYEVNDDFAVQGYIQLT